MINFLKIFAISASIAVATFYPSFASDSPDGADNAFFPFSSPEEMVQRTLNEITKQLEDIASWEKSRLDEFNKIDFSKIDMDFVDQNFKRLAMEKNIDEKVLRGAYFEPRVFWENNTRGCCCAALFATLSRHSGRFLPR